ncbi:hypothetical protein N9129_04660, partial [Akkermansiaceae bacterium]|nr:hypothetical protein [Akkermansiaceae bacterium]
MIGSIAFHPVGQHGTLAHSGPSGDEHRAGVFALPRHRFVQCLEILFPAEVEPAPGCAVGLVTHPLQC